MAKKTNFNHLEEEYIRELAEKRAANMKETFEQAKDYVLNWRKENSDKFDFLYHNWYNEYYRKINNNIID